jgi:hypothetical protein
VRYQRPGAALGSGRQLRPRACEREMAGLVCLFHEPEHQEASLGRDRTTKFSRATRAFGYRPPGDLADAFDGVAAYDVAEDPKRVGTSASGVFDLGEPAPLRDVLRSRQCSFCGGEFLIRAGSKRRRCNSSACDRQHAAMLAARSVARYQEKLGPALGECVRCSRPARRRSSTGELLCGAHFSSLNRVREGAGGR